MKITKQITADVAKKNLSHAIVAKQNDYNSRFLKVRLCNEGAPIEVSPDDTVVINAARADGESARFACEVNSDGTVTAPLTNWMLALDDVVICSISIIGKEGGLLTSTSFALDVEKIESSDSDIINDENYNVLLNLITGYTEAKQDCETATKNAESAADAANTSAESASSAATAANQAKAAADNATSGANAAAKAAGDAAAAANTAKSNADKATQEATTAAERAEAAAQAVGDEIDGIVFKDTDNDLSYLAKFRLIGGKPAIEYTEL